MSDYAWNGAVVTLTKDLLIFDEMSEIGAAIHRILEGITYALAADTHARFATDMAICHKQVVPLNVVDDDGATVYDAVSTIVHIARRFRAGVCAHHVYWARPAPVVR